MAEHSESRISLVSNKDEYKLFEPLIVVDHGGLSYLAQLDLSSFRSSGTLKVFSSIDGLSTSYGAWLQCNGNLTDSLEIAGAAQLAPHVYLILQHRGGGGDEKQVLDRIESRELNFVVDFIFYPADGGAVQKLKVIASNCIPATATLSALDLENHGGRLIEFGQCEIEKNKQLELGAITLTQPQPVDGREFAGEERTVSVVASVETERGIPIAYFGDHPKALKLHAGGVELEQAVGDTVSGFSFRPGEWLMLRLSINAQELSKSSVTGALQVRWRVEEPNVSGVATLLHEVIQPVDVARAQGEVIRVSYRNEILVPAMAETPGSPSKFSEAVFYDPLELSLDGNDILVLPLDKLDDMIENLTWTAQIDVLPRVSQITTQSKPLFQVVANRSDEIKLALGEIPSLAPSLQANAALNILISFSAKQGGKIIKGAVQLDAKSLRDPSELVFSLDFGASASAVRVGGLRDGDGIDLPLGEVSKKKFGPHREWRKDGTNVLLPMMVELDSSRHSRSLRDPFSLGPLECIGDAREAVEARLTRLGYSYDISVPALNVVSEPRKTADNNASGYGTIVRDLKRAFMKQRGRAVDPVWSLVNGRMVKSGMLKIDDLLCDVFRELGQYHVPRAMYESHRKESVDGEPSIYDRWLQAKPGDMKFIVTYPIGQERDRLLQYKKAGRLFAEALSGTHEGLKEPDFVPEALAAAFKGIAEEGARGARGGGQDGERVFACIDIGASTFDATLLNIHFKNGRFDPQQTWDILAHFGGVVGGEDLDDGLLSLAKAFLNQTIGIVGTPYDGMQLAHPFDNPARLDFVLRDRILEAKIGLHKTLMEQCDARQMPRYCWSETGAGAAFEIDLREIVEPKPRFAHLGGRQALPRDDTQVGLREVNIQNRLLYLLRIPKAILKAQHRAVPDADLTARSPAAVASLLGVAVPTLLLREAARNELAAPQWIISGRASLWPSVYEALQETIRSARDGGSIAPFPASPEVLKQRVIDGAHSLVISGCKLPQLTDEQFALVTLSQVPDDIGNGKRQHFVEEIEYLTYPVNFGDKGLNTGRFPATALPGLDGRFQTNLMSQREVQRLLLSFKIPLYQRLRHLERVSGAPSKKDPAGRRPEVKKEGLQS